ncbi:MAG: TRIC cation channel family protein [Clostridia bacterium]|nr:TRIC cation channel family protein [Clostridia bacterium]
MLSLAFIGRTAEFIRRHEHDFWLELADAIGLSVFCVSGVDVAIATSGTGNILLLIFCGCITGVGGGILRDICSAEIPGLFRKHIYFIPAIGGTMLYVFTYGILPRLVSMLISIAVIIVFRMLAHRFKWNMPVPGKNPKPASEP